MVGSTTIKPGGYTTLELPLFMGMHQGMGGQHLFGIDIRSNDPIEPVKTVRWAFDVKDITR